jgi:hypothetical protein
MPRSPDTAALADENHNRLEPDRNALEIFADAIFRHVLNYQQGFIAVRSFYENDDTDEVFRSSPTSLKGGFQFLIDVAVDDAYRAAQNPRPVVFCPPLAVFGSKDRAREADVIAGLVISVECDQRLQQARAELEAILGPATVVVRSGGVWTNDDGQVEDKLHLHWRLRQPATDEESLAKLKRARQLAAKFVGGDGTGTPINHPYRWPGGWHRKGEPRLVEIDTCNPDAEVDLDTALAALAAVAGHEGSPSLIVSDDDRRRNYAGGWIGTKLYRHEAELVNAANCPIANDDEEIPLVRAPLTESAIAMVRAMVRAIPNDYGFDQPTRPWFIKIGYAIKFALGGDPVGEDIYDEFAQRSPKYNVDDDTRKAYRGFDPDGRVDLNYLHYLANQANPFWDAELYKVQASSRDRTGDKAKSEGDDRQKEDDAGSKDEAKSSAASDKPNTNKTSSPSWSAALPLIDISKWDDEQPPPQEWVVQDRIPVDSVCLFSGEGAAGKSLLQLQLSIATALNRDWLGMVPSQGPALFIDAEDDDPGLRNGRDRVS